MDTVLHALIAALGLALAVSLRIRWLAKHPTVDCPECKGVGWLPQGPGGSWARGSKPCKRCDRSGRVTRAVVWMARVATGKRGMHPLARIERQPMPDRTGRQEVTSR